MKANCGELTSKYNSWFLFIWNPLVQNLSFLSAKWHETVTWENLKIYGNNSKTTIKALFNNFSQMIVTDDVGGGVLPLVSFWIFSSLEWKHCYIVCSSCSLNSCFSLLHMHCSNSCKKSSFTCSIYNIFTKVKKIKVNGTLEYIRIINNRNFIFIIPKLHKIIHSFLIYLDSIKSWIVLNQKLHETWPKMLSFY